MKIDPKNRRQPQESWDLPPSEDDLQAEVARLVHQEHKAMEKSLWMYANERLGRGGDPEGSRGSFYHRWKTEIWGVPIVLFLLFHTFEDRLLAAWTAWRSSEDVVSRSQPPADEESPESSPPPPPSRKSAIDFELLRNDSAAAWASFVDAHVERVAGLIEDMVAEKGLPRETVAVDQKPRFEALARKLRAGEKLSAEELGESRTGLFEYVIRAWQKSREKTLKGLVNLKIGSNEYPNDTIREFLESTDQVSAAGSLPTELSKSPKVQALVVMAWLEQNR